MGFTCFNSHRLFLKRKKQTFTIFSRFTFQWLFTISHFEKFVVTRSGSKKEIITYTNTLFKCLDKFHCSEVVENWRIVSFKTSWIYQSNVVYILAIVTIFIVEQCTKLLVGPMMDDGRMGYSLALYETFADIHCWFGSYRGRFSPKSLKVIRYYVALDTAVSRNQHQGYFVGVRVRAQWQSLISLDFVMYFSITYLPRPISMARWSLCKVPISSAWEIVVLCQSERMMPLPLLHSGFRSDRILGPIIEPKFSMEMNAHSVCGHPQGRSIVLCRTIYSLNKN